MSLELRQTVAEAQDALRRAEDTFRLAKFRADLQTLTENNGKLGSNEQEREIKVQQGRMSSPEFGAAQEALRVAQRTLDVANATLDTVRDGQRERWIAAVRTARPTVFDL